ncbi:uncharacterized protein N7496_002775 [Penicillium cataractarum]|uniref:C6 zinc finger domain protein n=1 Tax=Penicillium cataractarum TaxID=2100454 RepID=A0A9W9SKV1_9EURO|nr:uncharacterized protein N7496_002775 [Penicillium cataractarum]KAJ5380347.1 hypothetical protein N7496_002775 [Penicillium cataractarum]
MRLFFMLQWQLGLCIAPRGGLCPSLQLGDWLERGNPFAVAQYVKSINHLRKRLDDPNDSQCEHVALLTCLLFICFEMLQGNRPGAVAHLRNGLRILLTRDSPSVYLGPEVRSIWTRKNSLFHTSHLDELADTYARLDYESTMFGEETAILTLDSPHDLIGPTLPTPSTFINVTEARKSLDILSNAVYRLRGELLRMAASNIDNEIHEDWPVRYCVAYSGIRTVDLSKQQQEHLIRA